MAEHAGVIGCMDLLGSGNRAKEAGDPVIVLFICSGCLGPICSADLGFFFECSFQVSDDRQIFDADYATQNRICSHRPALGSLRCKAQG